MNLFTKLLELVEDGSFTAVEESNELLNNLLKNVSLELNEDDCDVENEVITLSLVVNEAEYKCHFTTNNDSVYYNLQPITAKSLVSGTMVAEQLCELLAQPV